MAFSGVPYLLVELKTSFGDLQPAGMFSRDINPSCAKFSINALPPFEVPCDHATSLAILVLPAYGRLNIFSIE